MGDKDERIKRRASGTDAMASCVLTDAEGKQVHVGEWLPQGEAIDAGKPKVRKSNGEQRSDKK